MARSHAIWLVMSAGLPVAAFTVKHELRTWLREQSFYELEDLRLFKCVDSPTSFSVEQCVKIGYQPPAPVTELEVSEVI